jgi:hypothetical protein
VKEVMPDPAKLLEFISAMESQIYITTCCQLGEAIQPLNAHKKIKT